MRQLLLVSVLLVAAGACATPPADVPQGDGKPEVLEPRAQVMPNGMGAVYFTVRNPSAESERLVSVETTAAGTAETHESMDENGVMRMVPRPGGFEIPAGGTLSLEPGGKHVMLMGPQLEEGATTIPLTLHFKRAGAIEIEAALLQVEGVDHGGMDHGSMDHEGMEHGGTEHEGTEHEGTEHEGTEH